MDSETKEVEQELAIKVENEDQAVDIAQMAPAFQAEDSDTKEVEQELAIKVENEDQAVDIAQMAPAFKAEDSAQAGASTQEIPHPPTLADTTASKSYTRSATP